MIYRVIEIKGSLETSWDNYKISPGKMFILIPKHSKRELNGVYLSSETFYKLKSYLESRMISFKIIKVVR